MYPAGGSNGALNRVLSLIKGRVPDRRDNPPQPATARTDIPDVG